MSKNVSDCCGDEIIRGKLNICATCGKPCEVVENFDDEARQNESEEEEDYNFNEEEDEDAAEELKSFDKVKSVKYKSK